MSITHGGGGRRAPGAPEWVREQLREDEGTSDIVAECEDGFKAVEAIDSQKPDLLILDIQMPGMDGFGVTADAGEPAAARGHLPDGASTAMRCRRSRSTRSTISCKPGFTERLHDALVRIKTHVRDRQSGDLATRLLTALDESIGTRTGS